MMMTIIYFYFQATIWLYLLEDYFILHDVATIPTCSLLHWQHITSFPEIKLLKLHNLRQSCMSPFLFWFVHPVEKETAYSNRCFKGGIVQNWTWYATRKILYLQMLGAQDQHSAATTGLPPMSSLVLSSYPMSCVGWWFSTLLSEDSTQVLRFPLSPKTNHFVWSVVSPISFSGSNRLMKWLTI